MPPSRCFWAPTPFAALARHRLADRRSDLAAPALDRGSVVGREDEDADAVVERERQQLLDRGDVARDVQQAPDLAGVAAGVPRGVVDDAVAAFEVAVLEVGEAGEPTVGLAADQPQHPRLERAEPDRDVVRGLRAALGAANAVVLTVDADAAALGRVEDRADDV